MKLIINIVLVALIAGLAYLLYTGISEPIKFKAEKDKRQSVVVERLQNIRTAQELYRDITGKYAPDFETLANVLKNDSIPFRQVLEDPDYPGDPEKFIVNLLYFSALDSLNAMGINPDDLRNVPFSDNAQFTMQSDTIEYQKTNVWVTETMTRYKEFMGPFADTRFMKYDDSYNPEASIGFGSMNSPNLEGNWK
jgi:hypothetical protein